MHEVFVYPVFSIKIMEVKLEHKRANPKFVNHLYIGIEDDEISTKKKRR